MGQKIAGKARGKRPIDTYDDAEAVLHETVKCKSTLAAQDAFLYELIDELVHRRALKDSTSLQKLSILFPC